jgi:hypothetical protein
MSGNSSEERSSAITRVGTGVAIVIVTGVLGYLCSYFDGIQKDRLSFTNEQIEKLYGPLYALTQANQAAWKQYGYVRHMPDWTKSSQDEIAEWRVRMKTALQPMNEKIEQVIVNNSQLVVGDKWPQLFSLLIQHIEGYRALISEWDPKDISKKDYTSDEKNTVQPRYPDKFDTCVEQLYLDLKKRQEQLREFRWQNYIPWSNSPPSAPTALCDP